MIGRGTSATLWSAIDIGSRQAVQFVVTIILARLLAPEDFGVIALLLFFSMLSMVFVQGGLTTALIQRQSTTIEEESAVFWWNLAAAILFAAILLVIAPLVARFYVQPVLEPLMLVAAAQVVVSALGAVQHAVLTRDLRFADLTKPGVIATLASGAAGIGAALLGYGVWALALQILVSAVVSTAVLWWVSDWRPIPHFDLRTIKPLLGFGAWLSLSSTLEVLYTQGVALLVGKLYGVRDLGLFSRAQSTQLIPTNILSMIIGRVALPLFSSRSHDPALMRQSLSFSIRMIMLLNLPVMVGLALLPDLVLVVLFGEKWLPAAPILGILAWGGLIFPLHVLNLQVLLAQGRSGTYFRVEVVKKIVGIAFLVAGSFYGLIGLAVSQLAFAFVALVINVAPVGRSLDYGLVAQVREFLGPLIATMVMGLIVLLLRGLLDLPPLPELVLLTGAGGASYAALCLLFRLQAFQEALNIVRPLLRHQPAAR